MKKGERKAEAPRRNSARYFYPIFFVVAVTAAAADAVVLVVVVDVVDVVAVAP